MATRTRCYAPRTAATGRAVADESQTSPAARPPPARAVRGAGRRCCRQRRRSAKPRVRMTKKEAATAGQRIIHAAAIDYPGPQRGGHRPAQRARRATRHHLRRPCHARGYGGARPLAGGAGGERRPLPVTIGGRLSRLVTIGRSRYCDWRWARQRRARRRSTTSEGGRLIGGGFLSRRCVSSAATPFRGRRCGATPTAATGARASFAGQVAASGGRGGSG
jgi:hypothetical protein